MGLLRLSSGHFAVEDTGRRSSNSHRRIYAHQEEEGTENKPTWAQLSSVLPRELHHLASNANQPSKAWAHGVASKAFVVTAQGPREASMTPQDSDESAKKQPVNAAMSAYFTTWQGTID